MKRLTRSDITAATPFPEGKPWLRKAIAKLYTHSGLRVPLHLLPPTGETP